MDFENSNNLDFMAGQAAHEGFSLAKIQVAPLIDTVLFLIWFYLLVGQLVMHQKDASVELPQMASALAAREIPAEVIVNLRQDGQVTVDGRTIAPAELSLFLAAQKAKAKESGQDLRVVLRADRRQRVGALDEIFKTCRKAGLGEIVFRAKEDGL